MTAAFLERLGARSAATGTVLCLGLDPDPEQLPQGFTADMRGVEAFARLLIETAAPFAAAIKPNLAFFEAFGGDGLRALERICDELPGDLPLIIDAKRGDIATTAARQAEAIVGRLHADAVTLNPYVGFDAIEPFLAIGDAFVYVLCRTSNPTAAQLQGLHVTPDDVAGWPGEPLFARVARQASSWAPPTRIGLVVGATAPRELAQIRAIASDRALLVPGVGAQSGDVAAVLSVGRATSGPAASQPGGGLLVNVSRGISSAASASSTKPVGSSADAGERIAEAAREWAGRVPVLW
ncbi:MAG TPA: orotidine-5'-phosphate decarboxylase [Candidatus Saccharimonadales bacterium]|nr:orotidine-5'-phosphate decarboxylase [Candidatus Saccharimonadales bacterium]